VICLAYRATHDVDVYLVSLDDVQNTHLDRNVLAHCVSLIENGVNPEALAVGTKNALIDWLDEVLLT
jgi:mitotic-spindle organizing protein 1